MLAFGLTLLSLVVLGSEYRASESSLGSTNIPWVMEQNGQAQTRLQTTEQSIIGMTLSSAHQQTSSASYSAIVPGTILTSILYHGLIDNITDPYYETNLKQFKDMYDSGRDYYTYWFSSNFTVLPPKSSGRIFLHLRGINYFATVYLNQQALKTTDGHSVEGQFQRHLFDITDYLATNGSQYLSILVAPVQYPGEPNGGQGGDHVIAENAATSQYVTGWDWVQNTPDRNTGIWDKISMFSTNDTILLQYPRIRTTGTTTVTLEVEVNVYNGGSNTVSGKVSYTIADASVASSQSFTVASKQSVLVVLPAVTWNNPTLWWPNLYGDQKLYNMTLVASGTSAISDQLSVTFGVRDLKWEVIGGVGNGYRFYVNGKSVFIRGGNWIVTDQLLRYSDNATHYDYHVRMHKEMGLNTIRVWGGGLAERPEFYDACDKYGLLVVQDFWMSGDCNGRWGGSYNYPDDKDLYLASVKDTVLMLRNHPSLLIYTGGNELDPANKNPPPVISSQMYTWLNFTNPPPAGSIDGSRPFIMSTMSSDNGTDYCLAPADGPYGLLQPRDWFTTRTPGLTVNMSFNPEAGSCSVPVIESLRKFFSEATLQDYPYKTGPDCSTLPEHMRRGMINRNEAAPVNSVWDYHKWEGYCDNHDINQIWRFGGPTSIDDFVIQAQLVGYEQYRALLEGYTSHMWELYNGIIIWKTQGPWTELRGHFYDWYLEQTGSFYGTKKATEHLHIQLSWPTSTSWSTSIVNHNYNALGPFTVNAAFYDTNGKLVFNNETNVTSVPSNAVYTVSSLSWPSSIDKTEVLFLRLSLSGGDTVQSENFYWVSYPGSQATQNDFQALSTLRKNPVNITGNYTLTTSGNNYITTVTISSVNFAFFIRLGLIQGQDITGDTRILPSWYSDNYFSLLPGESKTITIECEQRIAQNRKPWIQVSGFNVISTVLK